MAVVFHANFDGTNGSSLSTGSTGFTEVINPGIFSSAVKKSGTAAAYFATTNSYSYLGRVLPATNKRFWSFYVRPAASPSANTVLFFAGTSSDGNDRTFQVVLNTTRTIKVQQGAAAIILGSASTGACPLNEWSRIDITLANGMLEYALYPGDAQCDNPAGSAAPGNASGGALSASTISYVYIGIGNGTTNQIYIDEFREDTTSLPGPIAGGGAIEPYLYFDDGSQWVDVTESLWYDNGQSWVSVSGGVTPPAPVAPLPIAGWGSSSMAGTGGGGVSLLSELATAFSVTTNNYGRSGDWSFHTAAKMGAIPAQVTLPSNTMPASGSVVVTIGNIGDRGNSGTTLEGTLVGVPVSIVYNGSQWTLTRMSAGGSVSVPGNSPLAVTAGSQRRNDTNIIWTGKNDLTNDALAGVQGALDTTRACWDFLENGAKQRLVLGHFLNQNQLSGNARTAILNVNSAYAAEYGQYFVDVEGFLSSSDVWTRAGVSPTSADLTAQANRVLPPSLAYDNLHNNSAGYQAIGWLVRERMRQLGWYG